MGGAIGVAVTSSISISHFNHLVASGTPVPQAFTAGTQWAFWVTVGIAVAGLIATVTLIRPDEIGAVEEATAAAVTAAYQEFRTQFSSRQRLLQIQLRVARKFPRQRRRLL